MNIKHLTSLFDITTFKKYFKNTSWMMAERMLNIFVGIFVGIWVARYLEPERFGILSFSIAIVTVFAVVCRLGLNNVLTKELVNQPNNSSLLLGTSLYLQILASVVCVSCISAWLYFIDRDFELKLLIFVISIGIIFKPIEVIECYFDSIVRSKYSAISKSIQLVTCSIIKILLIIYEADLVYFGIVVMLETLILVSSYLVFYTLKAKASIFRYFSFDTAKTLFKSSWPFIFISLFHIINTRVDQIMLGELIGQSEVGLYSAAIRLLDASFFIPIVITSSLFPAILNARKESMAHYHNRFQQLFTLMFLISLTMCVCVSLLSHIVVPFLFGDPYEKSGLLLSILIWSSIFTFWGIARSKWVLSENLQKYTLVLVPITVGFNICLNIFLIPLYGGVGAAIATVSAGFVGVIILPFFIRPFATSLTFIRGALMFRMKF